MLTGQVEESRTQIRLDSDSMRSVVSIVDECGRIEPCSARDEFPVFDPRHRGNVSIITQAVCTLVRDVLSSANR